MELFDEKYNIGRFYENWNWKRECFITNCRCCGNIFISSDIIRCPNCNSGNIWPIPFRDHQHFCYRWLELHGFKYIKELIKQ